MSPLHVVIVDDEPAARLAIRRRLDAHHDRVRVVGEAADVARGQELVDAQRPDAVFLDIAMPGVDGMQWARSLCGESAPMVVFLTAFGDRAVEAFETEAVDYLMKPVSKDRLLLALDKLERERVRRADSRLSQELRQVVELRSARERTLDLDTEAGWRRIDEALIEAIEAAGDYACLHLTNETYVVRKSLRDFEDKLGGAFYRIHRNAIVRLDAIRRIDESTVHLKNGKHFQVSRRRLAGLRARLG